MTMMNGAHSGLAMLSVLLTLAWAGIVVAFPGGATTIGGVRKGVYIGAMAITGLVGLTGLIAVAMSPYLTMWFPWLGLLAVMVHGWAGAKGRRALVAQGKGRAIGMAVVQLAVLVIAYGLMTAKPF